MENEVKPEVKVEEPKKKGNGFFTVFACVMTGIIVFLATNLGDKASKVVDPETNSGTTTTSNVESNVVSNVTSNAVSNTDSNVVSNVTSNVVSNTTTSNTAATKLSDSEALAIGKDLYTKANENVVNPLNARKCTQVKADGSDFVYDCTNAYNYLKTIFVSNSEVFKVFKLENGKYMYYTGATGSIGTYTTTLSLVSVSTDKLVFTANTTIDYGEVGGTEKTADAFEVVKENGTWKVSKFTYHPTTLK